ncbi:hypothetical protein [Tautonia marina]|uniref:hypothetical protein n=1 Tax=Tautonia marina TaxID=2653855 RepID=UPI001260F6C5|nr:hypothetical protein [Tautonia marina]
MNTDRWNLWLAIITFLATVVVLIVARSASRRKAVWRIAEVARELGLAEQAPNDPELRSWLDHPYSGILDNDRSLVWALRGSYEDREVVLLGIHERSSRSVAGRSNDDRARRFPWFRRYWTRGPAVASDVNQLLVVLVEALPGLPDFRIGPDATAARGAGSRSRGSAPRFLVDRSASVLFEGLMIDPETALGELPQTFLDRAARVLVGRRHPWTIEGFDERMSVRIARWRSPSRVRSYRAVLDDALSLRAAWELRADRSDDAETHRSIRSALERIRQASESSESDGGSLQEDRT